jgi:isopentenyl-diphosphate delta-isomerase
VDQELILVDVDGNPIGVETKIGAHEKGGKLHRAFSIFIFDAAGKMLLQRRAKQKYHFGGLWTNACCGHPGVGETLQNAAHTRLEQEFGFDTHLVETFSILYRAFDAESGLTEHEFDHVFCGEFNGEAHPNPDEIDDWKWVDPAEVLADLNTNPDSYTPWFKIAVHRVIEDPPESTLASQSPG